MVAAELRSLPIAVAVGLLMGIATSLIQRYLPPASAWTTEIIDAVPFIVIALVLIYNLVRRGRVGENDGWGGALDRAIMPQGESRLGGSTSSVVETASLDFSANTPVPWSSSSSPRRLPLIVQGYWVGLMAQAFAFGIIFLSWTIVTGEGGMLWLCQITFAGVGALTTAQLANNHGWPVLAAVLAGGVVALVMGIIIGFLSIRLGDLYVALVTLTFGLLMENLVFTLPSFVNQGLGLSLNRPGFAASDRAFAYLCLVVFVLVALFIVNLRRSTTGLALNAARWSAAGARTSGISVVQMKVISGALAALIAGIGGGLLALSQTTFQPSEFATFAGVIWLAVLVTIGVRSNVAALVGRADLRHVAGPRPGLPADLDGQPAARALRPRGHLGGQVARGVLAEQGRRLRRLVLHRRSTAEDADAFADGAVTPAPTVGPRPWWRSTSRDRRSQRPDRRDERRGARTASWPTRSPSVSEGSSLCPSVEPRGRAREHRRPGRAERCRKIDAPGRAVGTPASQHAARSGCGART